MRPWPLVCVVFGWLLLFSARADADRSVPPEFDRAARAAARGAYAEASQAYRDYLGRDPGGVHAAVAAYAVAQLDLEALRDTAAALRNLEWIVKERESTQWAAEAAWRIGSCREERGEWREAAESFLAAARLGIRGSAARPGWVRDAVVAAAGCFAKAGDPERTLSVYEEVLASDPPLDVAATAHFRIGEAEEARGAIDRAAARYLRVLEEYPISEHFADLIAKRPIIDAAVEVDWRSYLSYAEGSSRIQSGDYQAALAPTLETLASNPNPRLKECAEYRRITLETALAADFTLGCKRLERYIEENPAGLRTEMARSTLERLWTPIAEMEGRCAEDPPDQAACYALAGSYLRAGSAKRALEVLEVLERLPPDGSVDPAELRESIEEVRKRVGTGEGGK